MRSRRTCRAASNVGDLASRDGKFPYVHRDHPVSYALERMGVAGVDVVPVVSRADIRQMFGTISLADILAGYGVEQEKAVQD